MKYTTHICFVSNETDANFLPLIDSTLRPKNVILFVTKEMLVRAKWLINAMKGQQIVFKEIQLDDAYDIDLIKRSLNDKDLFMNLGIGYDGVVVNITGGTKAMAIATFETCSELGIPYFYLNIKEFTVSFYPGKLNIEKIKLDSKYFDISRYLIAHGYEAPSAATYSKTVSQEEERFVDFALSDYKTQIPTLNYLAANADKSCNPKVKVDNYASVSGLLSLLEINQWVNYSTETKTLSFKSETIKTYLNGQWLELYLANVLRSMLGSTKIYQGLVVKNSRIKNEIDVAFFLNNKLHIIEVKTRSFNQESNDQQDYFHKLSSIAKELGGLTTKKCFLSLMSLNDSMRRRAKNGNIYIIEDGNVCRETSLRAKLLEWINKPD